MTSNIVITIDGRSALPLRALPYMTAWAESPDSLVRAMALEPMLRVGKKIQKMAGHRVEILNRHALGGYRMMADGNWTAIPSTQWQSVTVELSSLTAQMKADERQDADGENFARWRVAATLALPDDVFVWLDDFERWFAHTRPLAIPSDDDLDLWRIEQAKLYADEDLALILQEGMSEFSRLGSIDYVIILPNELVDKMWRYGTAMPGLGKVPSLDAKPRVGRPRSQAKKSATLGAIMALFASVDAVGLEPMSLPGRVADLLEACQRIEKTVMGKTKMFSVSEDTFRAWLSMAGYGFATGRTLKGQEKHWTRFAPEITGKTSIEIFQ